MVRSEATARKHLVVALLTTSALVVSCRHLETAPREQPSAVTVPPPASSAVTAPREQPSAVTAPPPASSAVTAPPQTQTFDSAIPEILPQKPCRLLAVGDSLTDPKSAGGGYLTPVERDCGCRVTNLGKGGDMVNQMKSRLLAYLRTTPNRYDYVLVFGGVNDLYSDETAHRTVSKIASDLTVMYQAAKAHGAKVIAVSVAPWSGFRRWYNPKRAAATRKLNAFIQASPERGLTDNWIDAYTELSCGEPERLCDRYAAPHKDGLHFGPIGHQRLGMALVSVLGKERCPRSPDAGPARRPKPVPPKEPSPSP